MALSRGRTFFLTLFYCSFFAAVTLIVQWSTLPDSAGAPADAWIAAKPKTTAKPGADSIRDPRRLSPALSAGATILADGIVGVAGVLSLALALRHRRRALAEKVPQTSLQRTNGLAVAFGKIEFGIESSAPVAFRIWNPERHKALAVERRETLAMNPFILRLDDGTALRVEPDEQVVLQYDSHPIPGSTPVSINRALVPGKYLRVTGALIDPTPDGGDFRHPPAQLMLRAPPSGQLVLSIREAGWWDEQLAEFYGRWAKGAGVLMMLLLLIFQPVQLLLTVDGRYAEAHVTNAASWYGSVSGSLHRGVQGIIDLPDQWRLVVEARCEPDVYREAVSGQMSSVPFTVSRHIPHAFVMGSGPSGTLLSEGASVTLAVAFAAFYLRRYLPWRNLPRSISGERHPVEKRRAGHRSRRKRGRVARDNQHL